jgi:aromatic ring hydroxylase
MRKERPMAVLAGKEYLESLKALSPEVYMRGERVADVTSHPLMFQTINHIASGLDLIQAPDMKDRAIVHSPVAGEAVPRISLHIQQEKEDLFVKAELTREIASIAHPAPNQTTTPEDQP